MFWMALQESTEGEAKTKLNDIRADFMKEMHQANQEMWACKTWPQRI